MVEKGMNYWPEGLSSELLYHNGKKSLYEYLTDHANQTPKETSYIFYGNEISWEDLLEQVNRLAGYFQRKGVKKGDRVAIFLQNCPQYIIAHYAIQQLGGVVVPLNPMYKADELSYFFEEAPICGIISSDDGFEELLKADAPSRMSFMITTNYKDYLPEHPSLAICEELTFPKKIFEEAEDFLRIVTEENRYEAYEQIDLMNDIGLMVFTSGTTGRPKGAQLTYGNALFKTAAASQANGITANDRLMASAPLSHIAGMVMGVNIPIYTGIPCVLFTRFDPYAAVQAIEMYQISSWYSIAPMNGSILQIPEISNRDLTSLKNNLATSFGIQVTEELANKWKAVTKGCVMYEAAYGLSETHTCDTFMPKDKIKFGSCGIPIYETEMKIIHPETGEEQPRNQSGEIILKSPGVFKGYFNRPEATAETLKDGWVYTGDIGYMDNDGYLYFQGWVKEMIKCSGFSVFPEDVEALLNNHPAIRQSAVIGIPDPVRGETIKAFIVLHDSYNGQMTENDIISWSKEHMAAYKYPRYVEFIDQLPTTASGKVLRKLLKDE
ncbi:AMP-binding protein [Bacillus massilinigeriensis]|uniref:AMP-binding protein n=1 Tax=Bacillus massilionigeriensis TaxID=1805475 RepID=UPI000AA858E3|nr:AMP-binding protein [Bacillus massilionigeriensis]